MPIRDIETFFPSQESPVRFLANRGANGIDGTVSSAIGAALAHPERRAFLLTGELALIHDLGGLAALRRVDASLTIVCVNNEGGGIFDFLPVAGVAEREAYVEHILTPSELPLSHVAAVAGLPHVVARTAADVRAALGEPALIEYRSDRASNVREAPRGVGGGRRRAALAPVEPGDSRPVDPERVRRLLRLHALLVESVGDGAGRQLTRARPGDEQAEVIVVRRRQPLAPVFEAYARGLPLERGGLHGRKEHRVLAVLLAGQERGHDRGEQDREDARDHEGVADTVPQAAGAGGEEERRRQVPCSRAPTRPSPGPSAGSARRSSTIHVPCLAVNGILFHELHRRMDDPAADTSPDPTSGAESDDHDRDGSSGHRRISHKQDDAPDQLAP